MFTPSLPKPADMFDREADWSELVGFATNDHPGATLGVVSGRRRQGKTFLLTALVEAAGGFYLAAAEGTGAEALAEFGAALARHHGASRPYVYDNWDQVVDDLLALGTDRPTPVVIDEFPYLAKAVPALPSIIQRAYGPRREERQRSRTRLLLCGSAMAFMGGLLSGTAPLRGRAGLHMTVHPLRYKDAARFWQIDDPKLAVLVHAILGGTPAYRREFVGDDTPADLDDFDDWVRRTTLNPRRPLYYEADFLLAEEPALRDRALYHSVLASIAQGNQTVGGIANHLGRSSADLNHPMKVLQACGLVRGEHDAFRAKRPLYRIGEPLITFHHGVVRPFATQLTRLGPQRTWELAKPRFLSGIVGPHFEQLCREWAWTADDETFGGVPSDVSHGTVADPAGKTMHEVDVVVRGTRGTRTDALLAVGEAKWNETMGAAHLDRLRHILALLHSKGVETRDAVPVCFSGAGFTDELREAQDEGKAVLVDLTRLYQGG